MKKLIKSNRKKKTIWFSFSVKLVLNFAPRFYQLLSSQHLPRQKRSTGMRTDFPTFILTISSTGYQAPQLKFSLTIRGLDWIIFEFQVKHIHFSLTSSLNHHTFEQQSFPLPHVIFTLL